jgi:hypothetical protein
MKLRRPAEQREEIDFHARASQCKLLDITPMGGIEQGLNKNFSFGLEGGYS